MTRFWDRLSLAFTYLLILGSAVMFGWGALGFLEYFTGSAPLMPLQNATFPGGTQFIHWLLITVSGLVFPFGYFTRWRYTPIAMMIMFTSLATLCAVQTFDFLENPSRYGNFVRELVYYVIISIYLVRSKRMRDRFGQITTIGRREDPDTFTDRQTTDGYSKAGTA
ncbi:MAG: hypothetical protein AAF724_18520 [Pseudomonadota bacterium]